MPETAALDRVPDTAPLSAAHKRALDWVAAGPKQLWIDGKWRDAGTGETIDSINPETERKLTAIADASSADVDAAVIASMLARMDGHPIDGRLPAPCLAALPDVEVAP